MDKRGLERDIDRRLAGCPAAEIAAITLIDACVRLIPGVLGAASIVSFDESFLERVAGIPAVHLPAGLGRRPYPGRADFRRSRQGCGFGGARQAEV